MDNHIQTIAANWSAPTNVKAYTTTRTGGFSQGQYATLNLAIHVGDNQETVLKNREFLSRSLSLPEKIGWLKQVHGNHVIDLPGIKDEATADGSYCNQPGLACVVLTADCLPLLMCNRKGTEIAAVHVGWRGLCADIITQAVKKFRCPEDEILVCMGPCISQGQYETGDEVRASIINLVASAENAFKPTRPGHWLMDLKFLARKQLQTLGIQHISSLDYCTHSEPGKFFSYRRDGETGRFASLIWMDCQKT